MYTFHNFLITGSLLLATQGHLKCGSQHLNINMMPPGKHSIQDKAKNFGAFNRETLITILWTNQRENEIIC